MTDVELAIKYLENKVNSDYWSCIINTDDFREIKESILILTKELKSNSIPKDKIREIVKKLQSYSDIAEQQINQSTIIADSDSLNYGRKEAHITDIRLLEELLEEE